VSESRIVSKGRKNKKKAGPHGVPAPSRRSTGSRRKRSWMETHGRDLRFLVLFGMFMGVYYVGTTVDVVKNGFFPWYLESSATVSTSLLKAFGNDDLIQEGKRLKSKRGAISVERGCDAVAPTALFVSALLASPALFRHKWRGLLAGVLILMGANILRIATLYLTRVYWIKAFDVMHLDIWQGLFILLAILLWAFWASWASSQAANLKKKQAKASADAGG